jgi:hypothetical protein
MLKETRLRKPKGCSKLAEPFVILMFDKLCLLMEVLINPYRFYPPFRHNFYISFLLPYKKGQRIKTYSGGYNNEQRTQLCKIHQDT